MSARVARVTGMEAHRSTVPSRTLASAGKMAARSQRLLPRLPHGAKSTSPAPQMLRRKAATSAAYTAKHLSVLPSAELPRPKTAAYFSFPAHPPCPSPSLLTPAKPVLSKRAMAPACFWHHVLLNTHRPGICPRALGPESSDGGSCSSSANPGRHQEHHATQDSEGRLLLLPSKPSPLLTAQEAVVAQLEALKAVYHPNGDLQLPQHGLEVLYNFASIDPFSKGSAYFGKHLNVAYFSQFSAKFSLREFRPLLGMHSYEIISSLHLSSDRFCARVGVRANGASRPAVFLFDLEKKQSGQLQGCWVTLSLQRVEEGGEGG